jgi:hypothetical protein
MDAVPLGHPTSTSTITESPIRAASYMLNIFADRRGYFPTLLDQPSQEYPAVEPHIMLSKVWNALADAPEAAPAPSGL